MILECIVTTLDSLGSTNIAPMGPVVDDDDLLLERFELRPYASSKTLANLQRHGAGVLHITDDVLLLARAAIGQWSSLPQMQPATSITGQVLTDVCRWYEFTVQAIDTSQPRAGIRCQTVQRGHRRDFVGFNRAKHAVVEAAILMTRLEHVSATEVQQQLERLAVIVDKTAGQQERAAQQLLNDYYQARLATPLPVSHG